MNKHRKDIILRGGTVLDPSQKLEKRRMFAFQTEKLQKLQRAGRKLLISI